MKRRVFRDMIPQTIRDAADHDVRERFQRTIIPDSYERGIRAELRWNVERHLLIERTGTAKAAEAR